MDSNTIRRPAVAATLFIKGLHCLKQIRFSVLQRRFTSRTLGKARGVGFEPTCPFGHGISNPTPCQARRPPPASALSTYIILTMFRYGKLLEPAKAARDEARSLCD